jgi:hypothetical protein
MSEIFPYVDSDDQEPPLPPEEALVLLAQAEEERAEVDAELDQMLSAGIGLINVFGLKF